ncbi:MAG: DUF401 family protein [Thermodesulfobacteriota bacterium]|nr:DUF401 family protein [Thermodesulfobacteriota bacterium]
MSFLQSIPAILRVLFVFILVLIALRKRMSLGHAFLLGAIFLGLIFGLNSAAILHSMLSSVIHPKTLSLALIVSLILVLSHSMELSGQMQRLLASFQGLIISPRLNIIIFPPLIGLLPMPGGAIFSAPMVKTLGERLKLSGDQLSFINYWFRHIWEYWWPFYPGVMLTVTLASLNLWGYIPFLFPFTLVAIGSGYWLLKGFGIKTYDRKNNSGKHNRPPIGPFIEELEPILIVILLGFGMGFLFSLIFPPNGLFMTVSKEAGLIVALLIAIGKVWHKNGLSRDKIWKVLSNRQLLNMVYMVISILIFKGILEHSHAVKAMSNELIHWHIPLMLIIMVLPFFVGWVVGITIAFVGATFPILIALVQSFGEGDFMLAYIMLGFASGYVGVLLSPMHICLLLSNEYFGAKIGRVYSYLWLPCAVILGFSMIYFWLLHWVWPA